MKTLVRHIDLLLRDNDCVILPGFGGFIAQTIPAYYVKEEQLYYPPSRSISFNAAITINDGVLAQSYMKSYSVDYARANYMIDVAMDQLRDVLDEEGIVTLPRIGTLKQDIHQSIQFIPETSGVASPQHFGLGAFAIKDLALLLAADGAQRTSSIITQTEKTIDLHIHKRTIQQILSTAAIFLLLLMVSMPIGFNKPTDIASLRLKEIVNTTIATPQKETIENPTTIDTVNIAITIAEEPIAVAPLALENTQENVTEDSIATPIQMAAEPTIAETITPSSPAPVLNNIEKTYHIIVASLPNRRGAEETLNQYMSKGYTNVSLVEKDDRIRISLMQFTDKDKANEYLKTLRLNENFQNAWLLAVRD